MESAGMTWRKSTYSTGGASNCVEVGQGTAIVVRDTKDHGTGTVLSFDSRTWSTFVGSIK